MLNIEDIDKVIQLLEQNNWDEMQAANAHYAQEVSDTRDNQTHNDNMAGEVGEGYR